MTHSWMFWLGFHVVLFLLLYLDLHYFNKKSPAGTLKAAIGWSAFWVFLSLLFNMGIYFYAGKDLALQFFTGYLIEKSLSIDNIFIFLVIFSFFHIEKKYQHKILYFGILGALIFRLSLILLGVALLTRFIWMYYLLGAFLCLTAIRFFFEKKPSVDMEKNWVLSILTRYFRVTSQKPDGKFFLRQNGKIYLTSSMLALIMIETADIIFAIDSIPAILAITTDTFIVYTSNVCAILGLRSLYFVIAHLQDHFHYLKTALALILFFIGMKMLFSSWIVISTGLSLTVVVSILVVAVLFSYLSTQKKS